MTRTLSNGADHLIQLRTNPWGEPAITHEPYVNVTAEPYGAAGDGVTDDTTAIQNAIDECAAAGGGVVLLPAGTYMVDFNPATNRALRILSGNVTLQGAGIDATVIKLKAAANATSTSDTILACGAWDGAYKGVMHVRDLSIDGNGANQTAEFEGLRFDYLASGSSIENVMVQGIRSNGTLESGCFVLSRCINAKLTNCVAVGTAGRSGSGFMDNYCSGTRYTACTAIGFDWCGLTTWYSTASSYANCIAHTNAGYGFNCEYARDTSYANCQAGLKVPNWTDPAPDGWPADTEQINQRGFCAIYSERTRYSACGANHGTYGYHFSNMTNVLMDGCTAEDNGTGIYIPTATNEHMQLVGCSVSNSISFGYYTDALDDTVQCVGCKSINNPSDGFTVVRPSITGARSDGTALANLLGYLDLMGIITDSTTAS